MASDKGKQKQTDRQIDIITVKVLHTLDWEDLASSIHLIPEPPKPNDYKSG